MKFEFQNPEVAFKKAPTPIGRAVTEPRLISGQAVAKRWRRWLASSGPWVRCLSLAWAIGERLALAIGGSIAALPGYRI